MPAATAVPVQHHCPVCMRTIPAPGYCSLNHRGNDERYVEHMHRAMNSVLSRLQDYRAGIARCDAEAADLKAELAKITDRLTRGVQA